MILIDNPKYDKQNVSHTAVHLKEKIRSEYKQKIEDYYKDIIIHQCPPNGPGITVLFMMKILFQIYLNLF